MTDIFSKSYVRFLRLVSETEPECQEFPDLFFPEEFHDPAAFPLAKSYCRRCPIQVECAMYAINNNELHGIWGGLTPGDRLRARKRLNLVKKKTRK